MNNIYAIKILLHIQILNVMYVHRQFLKKNIKDRKHLKKNHIFRIIIQSCIQSNFQNKKIAVLSDHEGNSYDRLI